MPAPTGPASTGAATTLRECNPEGQFGWLEVETGVPISEAIADYLLGDHEP